MELIITVHGISMSNVQHSVIRVCYNHAVKVWYGPDELSTLDPGSSRHLSRVDGAWYTAKTLAGGAWVHWLGREPGR